MSKHKQPRGRINIYACGGMSSEMIGGQIVVKESKTVHETVTIDRDRGTTPFMIDCRHNGCKNIAYSQFYPLKAALREPTHEFYKPDKKEMKTLDPATFDHCQRGGLLLREIQKEAKH